MARGHPPSFEEHESSGHPARPGEAAGTVAPRDAPGTPAPAGLPRLIPSRLQPPRPLVALVRREELLRRLSATRAPLVALSAPGGWGKTVALSQWVADCGVPSAWIQADAADDPSLFLQYLTVALSGVLDVDPRIPGWLTLSPLPVERRILPVLASALATAAPFVLVIDDAHLVSHEASWKMLGTLMQHLPPGSRLCLGGRGEPRLPLARLGAEGRLLELGPADLAFSPAETQHLLALHDLAAGLEAADHLTRLTEGWPVSLGLVAMAGEGSSVETVLERAHGDRRDIARYLGTELLEQQSRAVIDFLLQTSVLERLSASLCRAVTGDRDAGLLLETVARKKLFVYAVDDSGEWYRYQHLASQFLLAELVRRRGEDEAASLHRRAAAWFEEHRLFEAAVRHWLAGGDARRAGVVVRSVLRDRSTGVRLETLRGWLEWFSDEQVLGDHALLFAAAVVGTLAGSSPRARLWLGAALSADVSGETSPSGGHPLTAMQAGLRADFAPRGVTEMERDAALALELIADEGSPMRAVTRIQLGVALWLSGRSDEALTALAQAEQEAQVTTGLGQIAALGSEALVLADLGRWDEATRRTAAALALVDELGVAHGLATLTALLAHARQLGHGGDPGLGAAVRLVTPIVDEGLPPLPALIADVILAESVLESGDTAGARHWAREGHAALAAWPDAGILRVRLRLLDERLEERDRVEPLTPAERRVLELLPTQLSFPEMAARLFVGRTTVKTHVQHIYSKLGVSTRTEAVERARGSGLLPPQ